MIDPQPLDALKAGAWCKLICGASYQHLPAIRTLAVAYGLAGVDCIDIAADPTVLVVVQEALDVAQRLRWEGSGLGASPGVRPWLMISLNDGEDPHFRKAYFDPHRCPPDCPRPCEAVCPTQAIERAGVQTAQCYGCGRCIPRCPHGYIQPQALQPALGDLLPQFQGRVDAVEIHTQVGHGEAFGHLWRSLQPLLPHLKLLAISCPYTPDSQDYLWRLYRQWLQDLPIPLLWQADGRPMSGDLGAGTTHLALHYGQTLLRHGPPGYVQLAGGTNGTTLGKLAGQSWPTAWDQRGDRGGGPSGRETRDRGAIPGESRPTFGGIAYGGYGRQLLNPVVTALDSLSVAGAMAPIESVPALLQEAIALAQTLVHPLHQRLPTPLAAPSG